MVRIDDGGMAVQMAEFVCHALIRHFRELDGYEDDVAARRLVLPPAAASRADYPVGIMGLGVLGERVARAVAHFEFPGAGLEPHAQDRCRACAASRARSSSTLS